MQHLVQHLARDGYPEDVLSWRDNQGVSINRMLLWPWVRCFCEAGGLCTSPHGVNQLLTYLQQGEQGAHSFLTSATSLVPLSAAGASVLLIQALS